MSIIGLDFGSHFASIALWFEDKDTIEVIADDLGSRTIPCSVAFRGEEIITGQSAISQQHKNPTNTFPDVRSLLADETLVNVFVPLLDKEISVEELASHFFRNIHNQIKQQVGKAVRDCVVSVPANYNETVLKRITDSAQAGGIRIKCFISDSIATALAYDQDDPTGSVHKALVVDMGWTTTECSVFQVNNGLLQPLHSSISTTATGQVLTRLLADFCAKDFQRRSKVMCSDNKKSMTSLLRECEVAIRVLSTGAETSINIDSLCEGVDYAGKITRARFEDLAQTPITVLRTMLADLLVSASLTAADIHCVLVSGGPTATPRVLQLLKSLFPAAQFPRGRLEPAEAQSVGACMHGKYLSLKGLLDSVPTAAVTSVVSSKCLYLSSSVTQTHQSCSSRVTELAGEGAAAAVCVLPMGAALPAELCLHAVLSNCCCYLRLCSRDSAAGCELTPLAELLVELPEASDTQPVPVVITLNVSCSGAAQLAVAHQASRAVISSIVVSSVTP